MFGRFISEDPLGFPGGPDVNLYAYVGNGPLGLSDPFGLDPGNGCGFGIGCILDFFKTHWASILIIAGTACLLSTVCSLAVLGAINTIPAVGPWIVSGILTLGSAAAFAFGESSPSIQANKAAGDAFRDEVAGVLQQAGRQVTKEVVKRTPFGTRVIDIEVSVGGRILGGIETKLGSSPYLPSQQAKDAYLRVSGYLVNVVRRAR